MRITRVVVSGALIAAGYLVIASLTFESGLLPVRPFFEGTAPPQAYKWVKIPKDAFFSGAVQGADPGVGTIKLSEAGSEATSISTLDGQALLSLYQGSIKTAPGETSVTVTITPVDAASIGSPPKGLAYDSNAYRMEAVYSTSGEPAQFAAPSCSSEEQPKVCPTIVLRYARGAKSLYSRQENSWTKLIVSEASSSLQLYGDVSGVGTFVAAGHFPSAGPPPKPPIARNVALGLGALSALAAASVGGTKRGRRWLKRFSPTSRRWSRKPPPSVPRAKRPTGAKPKSTRSHPTKNKKKKRRR